MSNGDTTLTPKTVTKPKLQRPRLYKVILVNDDYTPREFVVVVLKAVFRMTEEQSYRVMMTAHQLGACVVATYTPREGFFVNLVLSALVLGLVNYPSISVWTLFGSTVGRALRTPQALRMFNGVMAGLLLLSLVPIFAEHV